MSVPSWRRNAQLFAAVPRTSSTVGIYVGTDGTLAQVNVGPDSTISVPYGTRYKPWPGDPVVLTWIDGVVKLTGPSQAKSKLGTVTNVSNPYIRFTCDGRSYVLPYATSYATPLVGDTVAIDWDGNYVAGAITATPDTGSTTPNLTTSQKPFTLEFFAKQSGSYAPDRDEWISNDLYGSKGYLSAWYYGSAVPDSLRDDAFITSVQVYLSLRTPGTPLPKIGHHSDRSRQDTGVSLSETTTVSAAQGWVSVPKSWANAWRAGYGGLGIDATTSIFRGIYSDRESGKLRISGRQ